MQPERYQRLKAAFLALRDQAPAAQTAGLTSLADPALQAEVEALLVLDRAEAPLLGPPRAVTQSERKLLGLAAATERPALVGVTLAGRYEVQALGSEGGFGWLFRAHDQATGEAVAVKVFKSFDDETVAAEVEAAFVREGAVLAALAETTPHIARYRDVGAWEDEDGRRHPYVVMAWLEGPTLRSIVRAHPQGLPLAKSVQLLAPIAQALASVHAQGIAHRDLKPENIVCVGAVEGAPVDLAEVASGLTLVDFGAVKQAAERARGFESTGGQVGMVTYDYSAPEQLRRVSPTGPWTDVYALALVVLELTLGHHPWAGLDVLATMRCTLDEAARPTARACGLVVSDAVEAVMASAVALDPRKRPGDAGLFWSQLCAALEEPPSPPRRGRLRRRLRR